MSSINNNIASVNKMEKILHSNLMNLKNCLEPISLDQFVVSTLYHFPNLNKLNLKLKIFYY